MEKIRNFSNSLEKRIKSIPYDQHYMYPNDYVRYTNILTDDIDSNPINPDKDFSFEEYSNAIIHVIKGSQPKFSIGIYGEWGSGKTTLMRLIEQKLKPPVFRWETAPNNKTENENLRKYLRRNFQLNWIHDQKFIKAAENNTIEISDRVSSNIVSINLNKDNKATLKINDNPVYDFLAVGDKDNLSIRENSILTVWFNAWRYESEDEFALVPLMKTIAFAMGEHPIYKDLKPKLLRGLAILGKDVLRHYAIQYIMTQKGVEQFEKEIVGKLENSAEFEKEVIYYDGIKRIEDELEKILHKYPDTRVVVFIDDLDRCSPEKALEVFESIKVFLDLKGFVFILGLSREALDKLIVARYEKIGLKGITGEEYIRKIIQIEIQIQGWNSIAIDNLIERISENLDEEHRKKILDNRDLIEMVVQLNPRQTKRFINNFIVALIANPSLDSGKFLVLEALHKRWKIVYDNISNARFLKEIKRGMKMSQEERETSMKKLEQRIEENLKIGVTPDNLEKVLKDFKPNFLDPNLWLFLQNYGQSILEKVSVAEEKPTEEETSVAADLESYKKARESSEIPIPTPKSRSNKKVLIIHGRDKRSKYQLVNLLERMGLEPITFSELLSAGETIMKQLEKYAYDSGYVFLLLTPDDIGGKSNQQLRPRVRQNLILELGYLVGKLGRDRMSLIVKAGTELPSDLMGSRIIQFKDNVEECLSSIYEELHMAGYQLSTHK